MSVQDSEQRKVEKIAKGEIVRQDGAEPDPETTSEALKNEETRSDQERQRPQIHLPGTGRPEGEFGEHIGKIIGPKEAVFRLEPLSIVEIISEEFTGELDSHKLAKGGLKFASVTATRMRTWVEQYVETGIVVKDENGAEFWAPKTMSRVCADSMIAGPQFLKHIARIYRILDVPIPIRTANGDIIMPKPGFNRSLGIYCDPNHPRLRPMSRDEAIETIKKVHQGFCWKSIQSRLHGWARLLTPYARGLMGFDARWPLWFFWANRPRAGKDYLNGVTQITYFGHAFEDFALTDNHEETMKRIGAATRSGRRSMHFANCQHHLNDPTFIQSITGPVLRFRALGSNDAKADIEVPNEIDFSLSANIGLTYREDVEPRLRKIDLAFYEEDPNKRTFPNPRLHDWIKANRGELLSAIAALFSYWIKQGAPLGRTLFNSFPQWAEIVGGVMTTCELGDPCKAHEGEDLIGGDIKERAMRALFQAAYESWPSEWLKKTDIYDIIVQGQQIDDRLAWFGNPYSDDEKTKRASATTIGMSLGAFQNRMFNGIVLELDTSTAKSQQWRYRFVKN